MDVNLNLSDYSYEDLRRLFKLPPQFTEEELREAKRIVARVHPDKSRLDGKYFRFFNEAYKLLVNVYETKHRKFTLDEIQQENPTIAKFSRDEAFNEKFNVLFDRYYIRDKTGYGDWLKSPDVGCTYEERKRDARAMVTTLAESLGSCTLAPSSLGEEEDYPTVQHVYTVGSVIGVSEKDHTDPPRTMASVMAARAVPVTPQTKSAAEADMARRGMAEDEGGMRRIYNLVKQQELNSVQTKKFEGHILQLTEFGY